MPFVFLWFLGLGLGRYPDQNPKPKFFLGKTSGYGLEVVVEISINWIVNFENI